MRISDWSSDVCSSDLLRQDAPPPPPPEQAPPEDPNQIHFSTGTLEYDMDADIFIARGDVRMFRLDDRLRADKVVWNRKTGQDVATGKIRATQPQSDTPYCQLSKHTHSLRHGVIQNTN